MQNQVLASLAGIAAHSKGGREIRIAPIPNKLVSFLVLLYNGCNMMRILTLCALIVVAAAPSYAEELTAQEIVKRSDDLMRGNTSSGRYRMTVQTPSWSRTLELDAYNSGRDKTFIRILSPAKEAGITTLRVKNNMWNYLPKVERTIKIPPSMMLQPWMGSDFTNDDLVKESSVVYDYTHTVAGEEMLGGDAVYKIQLIPKPEAPVTWGKLLYWIRKSDYVPLRQEYYAEDGRLIKVLEYSEIKQMSDRQIPTVWKMSSQTKPGNVTVIVVSDIVYEKPLDERIFTLENLK